MERVLAEEGNGAASSSLMSAQAKGLDERAGGLTQGPVSSKVKGCPQDTVADYPQIWGVACPLP